MPVIGNRVHLFDLRSQIISTTSPAMPGSSNPNLRPRSTTAAPVEGKVMPVKISQRTSAIQTTVKRPKKIMLTTKWMRRMTKIETSAVIPKSVAAPRRGSNIPTAPTCPPSKRPTDTNAKGSETNARASTIKPVRTYARTPLIERRAGPPMGTTARANRVPHSGHVPDVFPRRLYAQAGQGTS